MALSDEEIGILLAAGAPIASHQRDEFLRAVIEAIEREPECGPGILYRICQEVQRRFIVAPQRLTPGAHPLRDSRVAR